MSFDVSNKRYRKCFRLLKVDKSVYFAIPTMPNYAQLVAFYYFHFALFSCLMSLALCGPFFGHNPPVENHWGKRLHGVFRLYVMKSMINNFCMTCSRSPFIWFHFYLAFLYDFLLYCMCVTTITSHTSHKNHFLHVSQVFLCLNMLFRGVSYWLIEG